MEHEPVWTGLVQIWTPGGLRLWPGVEKTGLGSEVRLAGQRSAGQKDISHILSVQLSGALNSQSQSEASFVFCFHTSIFWSIMTLKLSTDAKKEKK